MSELNDLLNLRGRIMEEPAVTIERAAELASTSVRTLRRKLHRLEWRRGRNRHIYITVRSLKKFILREQYGSTREDDCSR